VERSSALFLKQKKSSILEIALPDLSSFDEDVGRLKIVLVIERTSSG
jgi:hypothetical protein